MIDWVYNTRRNLKVGTGYRHVKTNNMWGSEEIFARAELQNSGEKQGCEENKNPDFL